MTRVRVEPRSCDQGRSKHNAYALLATLSTTSIGNTVFDLTGPMVEPRKAISISFRQSPFPGSILNRPLEVSSRGKRHFLS